MGSVVVERLRGATANAGQIRLDGDSGAGGVRARRDIDGQENRLPWLNRIRRGGTGAGDGSRQGTRGRIANRRAVNGEAEVGVARIGEADADEALAEDGVAGDRERVGREDRF